MKNKKASQKYWTIIAFILGLIVVGISLYYLFNEYFTEDDINFETCRQSILMRANAPELKIADISFLDFKSKFPLKCKTQVIDIDKGKNATKEILNALVSCWSLFGNGDYSIFPSKFSSLKSDCVPCARIHFNSEVLDDYSEDKKIDLTSALGSSKINGLTYYEYLKNIGVKFPALSLASKDFNLQYNEFRVAEEDMEESVIKNRQTGGSESPKVSRVDLPRYIDSKRGDVLIYYGIAVSSGSPDTGVGDYAPYLFYFQMGQSPNPFKEMDSKFIDGDLWMNTNFCKNSEGIPA